jgi:hypothetical protein
VSDHSVTNTARIFDEIYDYDGIVADTTKKIKTILFSQINQKSNSHKPDNINLKEHKQKKRNMGLKPFWYSSENSFLTTAP